MTFRFSGTLMRFVDFQREHVVTATTVTGALDALVVAFPQLGPVLFTSSGALRASHRMFLNSEILDARELDRAVGDSDTLEILTAIAGG